MKTFKRTLTILLAVLMIFGLLVPGAVAAETDTIEPLSFPFTDVAAGSWYRPYVQSVLDQNIMQGTSSTRFSPNDTFSRGQIVATLFRIHTGRRANDTDNRNNNFTDVRNDAWYAPYVTWANAHNISNGTSVTRFGANDHVTRQEIATIMHNYVRNLTDHNSDSTATAQWNAFTDRGQITFPGAYDAFRWANNNGIVNGVTTTRLEPNGTATRAQAAAMLVRLVNFMGGGSQQPGNIDTLTQNGATWRELHNAGFSRRDIQGAFEREMIRLVNIHRATYGLPALHFNADLANVARLRAEETTRYGWHPEDGHRSWETGLEHTDHARAMGLNIGFAGENLASGFMTPQGALNAWLASPGHRIFVLSGHTNPNYFYMPWDQPTHIGIGMDFDPNHAEANWGHWVLWQMNSPRRQNIVFDFGFDGLRTVLNNQDHGLVPQVPTPPHRPGWSHMGWSPEIHPITQDNLVFTAIWERGNFTVWFDWNIPGRPEVREVRHNVPAGATPSPITDPAHMETHFNPGYRFIGWSPQLGPITGPTTFTAQWERIG